MQFANSDSNIDTCSTADAQGLQDDRLVIATNENVGSRTNAGSDVGGYTSERTAQSLIWKLRCGTQNGPYHHALATNADIEPDTDDGTVVFATRPAAGRNKRAQELLF